MVCKAKHAQYEYLQPMRSFELLQNDCINISGVVMCMCKVARKNKAYNHSYIKTWHLVSSQ